MVSENSTLHAAATVHPRCPVARSNTVVVKSILVLPPTSCRVARPLGHPITRSANLELALVCIRPLHWDKQFSGRMVDVRTDSLLDGGTTGRALRCPLARSQNQRSPRESPIVRSIDFRLLSQGRTRNEANGATHNRRFPPHDEREIILPPQPMLLRAKICTRGSWRLMLLFIRFETFARLTSVIFPILFLIRCLLFKRASCDRFSYRGKMVY